ncbi:hypothetical protein C7S15_2657 [Burkholderia cepacia]|nr:hypothetical protein [Burkholderia cepacia]
MFDGGLFDLTSSSLQAASRPAQMNPRHSDFTRRCMLMSLLMTGDFFIGMVE